MNWLLPNGLPLGIVLQGVVLGSVTGLTAMGIVLVYRASRIVNFAQAALGSAAGVLGVLLYTTFALPYFLAFAIGLVIAITVGAVADIVVMRRFFDSPRLVATLATVGLAQVLGGIELELPRWLDRPLLM